MTRSAAAIARSANSSRSCWTAWSRSCAIFGAGALDNLISLLLGVAARLGFDPLRDLLRLGDELLGLFAALLHFGASLGAGFLGRLLGGFGGAQALLNAALALVEHAAQRPIEEQHQQPEQKPEADEVRDQPGEIESEFVHRFACRCQPRGWAARCGAAGDRLRAAARGAPAPRAG